MATRVPLFLALAILVCIPHGLAALPPREDKQDKYLSGWQYVVAMATSAMQFDPKIKMNVVTDPSTNYTRITVGVPCAPNNCLKDVNATQKAIALATMLPYFMDEDFYDGSKTRVKVKLGSRTIAPGPVPTTLPKVSAMIKHALRDNSMFLRAEEVPFQYDDGTKLTNLMLVFQPKIIQTFVDNEEYPGGKESDTANGLLGWVYGVWQFNMGSGYVYTAMADCGTAVC